MKTQPKPKHTPSPWHVEPITHLKDYLFSINGADGFQPAHILSDGRLNKGTSEANARLIAAAPELLEALIDLHDAAMGGECKKDAEGYECRALIDARAAITKATA
jgi:hypothetical protein